ncbi:MAG: phosphatase PAP2 family protein [Gemmataceae bacterium]
MAVQWLKRLVTPRDRSRSAARRFRLAIEALEHRVVPAVDTILEWNGFLLQANAADHALSAPEQGGPILTARAFAIVSTAMYDAYNSVENIGDAYLVTAPNATNADADAAVAQAAHNTLVALYPSQQSVFDAELRDTLGRIPDGNRETRGRAVGVYVAQRILAARANDGAATMNTPQYTATGVLGFHGVDPLHTSQGFYGPHAGDIAPFAVMSVDQFAAPRLDNGTAAGRAAFLQSQKYTAAYNELIALGSDGVSAPTQRTAEQTQIGIFWAYDGRPGLGTPPRLYNEIARTLAAQEHNSEADNARMFALVNIAMADAGFTAWNDKYDNQFWRPIMGIRSGAADGNPATVGNANWTPLGAPVSNPRPNETNFTPPFPAYTSGHATFGAAAFQMLARFFGKDDIRFSVTSDEFNGSTRGSDGTVRPVVTRTFSSLTAAKLENAQSRIYLGIHWSFDATQGIRTGDRVANYVFDHLLQVDDRGHGHDGHGHDHDHGSDHKAVPSTGAGPSNAESVSLMAAPVVVSESAMASAHETADSLAQPVDRSMVRETEPTLTLRLSRSRAESRAETPALKLLHHFETDESGDTA